LDELQVLQIAFIAPPPPAPGASASASSSSSAAAAADARPHLAVLSADARGKRWLRTYALDTKEHELKAVGAPLSVEDGASWLVPSERFGGVLVVGEETVTYVLGRQQRTCRLPQPTQITAVGEVDAARVLIGDLAGNLCVVVLKHDDKQVSALHVERLGVTNSPHTISYLDNGYASLHAMAHGLPPV
jgi:hypothetical protein